MKDSYAEVIAAAKARSAKFPLLSINQVSCLYGISVRLLRRWQAAGTMPPRVKQSRRKMYHAADIRKLMARGGKP